MNYIASYYKNLCEQLQEKINILEARIRSPKEIEQIGLENLKNAEQELKSKKRASGKSDIINYQEYDELMRTHYTPFMRRAMKREELMRNATTQLGPAAQSGDVETVKQFGDVVADMSKFTGSKQASPEEATPGFAKSMKRYRDLGVDVNVPADIAAMRKVIQMGKGQYTPPFPTPETMHTTPSHY
jgi:hypothetical protein